MLSDYNIDREGSNMPQSILFGKNAMVVITFDHHDPKQTRNRL